MPVSLPTPDQLKRIAEKMNLSLTDADVTSFLALMKPSIDGYNVVDQLPDNLPPVKYPRTPGHRPPPDDNAHNAWYYKSTIEGAPQGKLKGKRVVVKDNVMVAGVPMMNGASTLEGYIPEIDATVVTRILDAGGDDPGQGPLRVLLPLRRQPHQRDRPGAQPLQEGLLGGRLLVGQRGAGGARRGRHGDRRRPGRLDPHARVVLRHLRHEADPRARALHRDHADRDLRGPHRPDDRHRGRQRADARGHRGARRLRSAPVRPEGPPVHPAARRGRDGSAHRGGEGGLRTPAVGGGGGRQGAAGRRPLQAPRGHRHRRLDPRAPARRRPLAAHRRRGAHPDHDVGRRLRAQPPGPLRDQPDGPPARLASAGRRDVRDHQALHDARHLHQRAARLPLLRQGDEHHPAAHRGLRRGAGRDAICC